MKILRLRHSSNFVHKQRKQRQAQFLKAKFRFSSTAFACAFEWQQKLPLDTFYPSSSKKLPLTGKNLSPLTLYKRLFMIFTFKSWQEASLLWLFLFAFPFFNTIAQDPDFDFNVFAPLNMVACGEAETFTIEVGNVVVNPAEGNVLVLDLPPGIVYEIGSVTTLATPEGNVSEDTAMRQAFLRLEKTTAHPTPISFLPL